MAKLKDLVKESFSLVGGVVSTPVIGTATNTGLTDIVEDIYGQKTGKVSAKEVQEAIREFSSYSKVLQKEENLQKIAERLSKIATNAKTYTVSETEDWFDKVTVNRNMKELTNLSKSFGKIAQESQALQQRLGGLYEDMGHILGRYYEIDDNGDSQEDEKIKAGLEEPKGHDIKEGDYEEFFQKAMKKFGIKSPAELDDEKKKEFFNFVDKNYKGKNEED
tara:strand:+ start:281 stop:940 length:660 start_codon:yes stop_codon:yes gene_type:complete